MSGEVRYKLLPNGLVVPVPPKYIELPDGSKKLNFQPDGQVLRSFMADTTSRVKIIQGPQGSGTSSVCCIHLYQMALAQPVHDGKRRFRAHIFRESYPKIQETVLKTWLDWFPPKQFGRFYETPPYLHEIRVGDLEFDVTFMALDDIRDAKAYFDSLETSAIWFNEGQYAHFKVISFASARVSPPRFPAEKDGGCAWGGLIVDTNAPPGDHWIPIMRGATAAPDWMTEDQRRALKKPANWSFYMQPAGLIEEFDEKGDLSGYRPNPDAENLIYLPENFYMEKIGGQTKSWIDANIMNRSTVVVDGKPVYPHFVREAHVASGPLEPIPGVPIQVGLDQPRNPAAIIGQQLRGDWFLQREFIGRDMSGQEFAPMLKNFLSEHYPGFTFVFWCDPAGGKRGDADDRTFFDVMAAHGMQVRPAPNPQNGRSLREEAVNAVLMRRSASGRQAALTVDPRCVTYITGMMGGYYLRRIQVSGDRYADAPEKNEYSHICEAAESLFLGGGEGRGATMRGSAPAKPVQTRKPYSPFGQRKSVRGF